MSTLIYPFPLNQKQAENFEIIYSIATQMLDSKKNANMQDVNKIYALAYIMATVQGECQFLSIPERKAKEGTAVWEMQKKYWLTGYYGRGFSQLTWLQNYQKFSQLLGMDLVNNPDLALDPEVGAKILIMGMRDGLFTGKKLADYFESGRFDYFNARRMVNGVGRKGSPAYEAAERNAKNAIRWEIYLLQRWK